ncbi:hypothetical protein [Miniphocaeibacter halophilus]|uniref:Uncharacterized protein n=1 Tax=Miniphocaeibacter halophilus TaxID=2931922 RepID=A0AC61MZ40_9FIRM|nr:hypothetical protein [Miniphocaeibacter halophilus]QQK08805.1 hypothetical protein JFY71_04535 [Miniphocaeibacter halophilus]
MKKKLKIIGLIALFIATLLIIFLVFMYFSFRPTQDNKRNISSTNVYMSGKVGDDERTPIIYSYKESEFNNFSKEEKEKIFDKIGGKVEGDIPAIYLDGDNKIYMNFFKDDKIIKPDNLPVIKIKAYPSYYDSPETRLDFEDNFVQEDDYYTYAFKRYHNQYEKYILEHIEIEVLYEVDKEKYISLLSINNLNTDDGTDFFENEKLSEPIPAE